MHREKKLKSNGMAKFKQKSSVKLIIHTYLLCGLNSIKLFLCNLVSLSLSGIVKILPLKHQGSKIH
jgi:hypothetical protein